jgi:hypothetical protein
MYVFEVTMTNAIGHDKTLPVRADDTDAALAKAERIANRAEWQSFEAWRARRVGSAH